MYAMYEQLYTRTNLFLCTHYKMCAKMYDFLNRLQLSVIDFSVLIMVEMGFFSPRLAIEIENFQTICTVIVMYTFVRLMLWMLLLLLLLLLHFHFHIHDLR